MTADRLVASAVLGWTALAALVVSGLAWLATAVETVPLGTGRALLVSALQAPGLVLSLVPTVCGIGAALASARMLARGERVALEGLGLGPWRTGRAALAAGVAVGMAQWALLAWVVPPLEARAADLVPERAPAWVWVDGAAVRLADGLAVEVDGGRIGRIGLPVQPPSERVLAEARMLQRPETASSAVLARSDLDPARLERQVRLARVVAGGLLALLGWLPLARRPGGQVGTAIALVTCWQAGALSTQAAAAQGRLGPGAGAWLPVILLAVGLVAAARWGRNRRYFTTSQLPV